MKTKMESIYYSLGKYSVIEIITDRNTTNPGSFLKTNIEKKDRKTPEIIL